MPGVNVVVPVKGYRTGKSRLRRFLGDRGRARLVRELAERTIRRASAAVGPEAVYVLSPDPGVLRTAGECGVRALLQEVNGLNEGLEAAGALLDPVRTLVVPADIPGLEARHLSAHAGLAGVGLSPDGRKSGTNLLSVPTPRSMPFRFGRASFAAHRGAARQLGLAVTVLDLPGLRLDLDRPRDLPRLRAATRGRRRAAASFAVPDGPLSCGRRPRRAVPPGARPGPESGGVRRGDAAEERRIP